MSENLLDPTRGPNPIWTVIRWSTFTLVLLFTLAGATRCGVEHGRLQICRWYCGTEPFSIEGGRCECESAAVCDEQVTCGG